KVDRLHERHVFRDLKYTGGVERLAADDEPGIRSAGQRGERAREIARAKLRRASGAAREGGEAHRFVRRSGFIHCDGHERQGTRTTASISTRTPRGRPETWTVERAGRASPSAFAYTSLTVGKSLMSFRKT